MKFRIAFQRPALRLGRKVGAKRLAPWENVLDDVFRFCFAVDRPAAVIDGQVTGS